MTIEQTHLRSAQWAQRTVELVPPHPLEKHLPPAVLGFIKKWVDLEKGHNTVILDTSTQFDFNELKAGIDSENKFRVENIVNLRCLNNVRDMNKFLESTNENLVMEGFFIGCVVTAQQRRERIMAKYRPPFNSAIYFFDYLIRRVWPKLPYVNRWYLKIMGCQNKVVSEIEAYGRLFSGGFTLMDTLQTDTKLYYAAQKTGLPDHNEDATYGPFIKLKRTGKNGKEIHVYKLRTMYPYSEYLQQYMYDKCGLQNGGKFKNDPRINAVGAFLRKYWLDELPMLVNWLKGDLKLFGVRPLSKQYLSLYPKEVQQYRQKFKPGLLPPFYADMPEKLEDIIDSEVRYLKAYERDPFRTDVVYFFKALKNIFFKNARSH